MELKRILLVEDNKNEIELILTALGESRLANEVVVVRDGEEALDYLYRRGIYRLRGEGHPAVVLLDIKIPKIDGFEVLQTIRSDEALKMLPVVVLTSSREDRDLQAGYAGGVNAYVVKPLDIQDFIEAVKMIGLFWAVTNEPPPRVMAVTDR